MGGGETGAGAGAPTTTKGDHSWKDKLLRGSGLRVPGPPILSTTTPATGGDHGLPALYAAAPSSI